MTRDPILFRVDANPTMGYDHLARCLTLAAALQRRRRPTTFLAHLEPAALGLNIKRGGNDWLPADGPVGSAEDLDETLQEMRRLRPVAVIVDAPEANEAYFAALRKTGTMVVALDHVATSRFPVQLLVNPLLSPSKEAYEFADDTQILMGPRYALVRPEIRRIRPVRAQEPPLLMPPSGKPGSATYRALIALGEDDLQRRTLEMVKILMNTPKIGRVDVVVRSYHPDLAALQALAEEHQDRLEIALETPEVMARLVRCHLAITSGSGWSLELASLGIPQLLLLQNEAYWPTAQRLEEEGCATCLGWYANVSTQTIRQAVLNLINDPIERQTMSRCGRKLIDGRGPDRFVTALEVMLHAAPLAELRAAA